MNRTSIIQDIIDATKSLEYLEIGIEEGKNFNKIQCEYKVGVDPAFNQKHSIKSIGVKELNIKATSDCFFSDFQHISHRNSFDVVFIDGLHHAEQVMRDIFNCIKYGCNEDCILVIHDCNPMKEIYQRREPVVNEWTGDVWKAWITLRSRLTYKSMFVVDCDFGVGVIENPRIANDLLTINLDKYSYSDLESNRNEMLNLKHEGHFKVWIDQHVTL